MTKYALAFFALQLGSGCGIFFAEESNYCSDALNHNCMNQIDAPLDAATGCKAAPDKCTGATPACDMMADKCVECTTASHDLCTGVEPVCGADETCRGCTTHSDCTSEVCLPDGSCAAEGDVAYVNGGTGTGAACTKAAPCKTLTAALATSKAMVKVKGVTAEPAGVTAGAVARRVFGDTGAQIATASVAPIVLASANTNIEFHQVTIGNEPGIQPPACILINNGTTATIKVFGGKIYGCQVGISNASSGGTVTVTGATVSGNTGGGISSTGGTVTVTGATVSGNSGGGITTTNGIVKLTNNFIIRNGNASTAGVGGVSLTSAGAGSLVDFNTIVDNDASTTGFGGIACIGSVVVATNSIFAGNRQNGASSMASQMFGCTAQTSAVLMSTASLMFKNDTVAPYDYHLQSGSVAIDAATTSTSTVLDVDGDARPQGVSKDQGADEFKP